MHGKRLWLLGAIAIIGVVIAGLSIGYRGGFVDNPLTALVSLTPTPTGSEAAMNAVIAQTRHFKGNASAPVTMIEFADFQ